MPERLHGGIRALKGVKHAPDDLNIRLRHPGAPVSRSIYALPIASAALSHRVEKVVGYPPLSEMSQRRELHEALLDADSFEDLPGKWQAAIVKAEQNRPKLRLASDA
jgi:hypothetical protein